jgi:RimJ/RimL family protein N-acetyltransferase
MDITPVLLEGNAVILEPLSLQHLDGLCVVGLDPWLWRITMTHIGTRDEMKAYIETALAWHEAKTALPFAIIEKKSGTVVGSTRFANIDHANRRAEIGWTWIARPWQRSAINTEAKLLLLTHAFERMECIRVEFKTDSINEQSRNALLRIGAREEGILRNHMITPTGRVRHSVYYSIVADEWPAVKQKLSVMVQRTYTT